MFFVGQVLGFFESFNIGIYSDTINTKCDKCQTLHDSTTH